MISHEIAGNFVVEIFNRRYTEYGDGSEIEPGYWTDAQCQGYVNPIPEDHEHFFKLYVDGEMPIEMEVFDMPCNACARVKNAADDSD